MDTIRRYSMLIGGDWVDADDRFEIRSPAAEELVASVAPGELSEGVSHRDGGGLLQRQYVAEIVGEFLQEGFLGRTGISEDGRQSEGSQQIVGHTSDGGSFGHVLLSQPPAGRASSQAHETELMVRALLTMNTVPAAPTVREVDFREEQQWFEENRARLTELGIL